MFIVARNHRPGPQSPLSENWVQHQPPHRNVMSIKTDTKGGVTSLKSPLNATGVEETIVEEEGEGGKEGEREEEEERGGEGGGGGKRGR